MAKALSGSKTLDNLKDAFASESQANRRYLYFARRADIEGYPDIGGLFRDTSEAETGHAFGHLDFIKEVGDPATGKPIGDIQESETALPVRPRIHRDVSGVCQNCSR
jgi:rubrerythrin